MVKQAICEKLRRDNDMTYTYGDILVSSGAKHTLFTILQGIIDPGDEVLRKLIQLARQQLSPSGQAEA